MGIILHNLIKFGGDHILNQRDKLRKFDHLKSHHILNQRDNNHVILQFYVSRVFFFSFCSKKRVPFLFFFSWKCKKTCHFKSRKNKLTCKSLEYSLFQSRASIFCSPLPVHCINTIILKHKKEKKIIILNEMMSFVCLPLESFFFSIITKIKKLIHLNW